MKNGEWLTVDFGGLNFQQVLRTGCRGRYTGILPLCVCACVGCLYIIQQYTATAATVSFFCTKLSIMYDTPSIATNW